MSNPKVNPSGSRQYCHTLRAKINNSSIFQMERLLGDRHGNGVENKMTAEWFLVTDHGSVTINDWWALNEGEFQIHAGNDRAALIAVNFFKEHKIQAHLLSGALT